MRKRKSSAIHFVFVVSFDDSQTKSLIKHPSAMEVNINGKWWANDEFFSYFHFLVKLNESFSHHAKGDDRMTFTHHHHHCEQFIIARSDTFLRSMWKRSGSINFDWHSFIKFMCQLNFNFFPIRLGSRQKTSKLSYRTENYLISDICFFRMNLRCHSIELNPLKRLKKAKHEIIFHLHISLLPIIEF